MPYRRSLQVLSFTTSLAMLGACSLTPDYSSPEVDVPASWRTHPSTTVETQNIELSEWWKTFENSELEELVKRGLDVNYDLAASVSRIAQSRALARAASAPLLPFSEARVDASRDRANASSGSRATESSAIGQITVGYEIDLFGRNTAAARAAEIRADASEFDADSLALIVAADVATAYTQILALNDQHETAERLLENAVQVLTILEVQLKEGGASALEVSQQRASVASTSASLISVREDRERAANRLAVLTGTMPQAISIPTGGLDSLHIPAILPLQPTDLLLRRPDIQQVEAQLRAANEDIGEARAALFPTVSIGLSAAAGATPIDASMTSALGVGSSLVAPLFQGGRLRAEVERTEARLTELRAMYFQTILISFEEAENALVAVLGATERTLELETFVRESQLSYGLARSRFAAGSIDYLSLLETQRSLFQAETSFITAKLDRANAAVLLYKALGGGWKREGQD